MSIWSKIGKALLVGAGAAAAPFTGGATLAASLAAGGIGAGAQIGMDTLSGDGGGDVWGPDGGFTGQSDVVDGSSGNSPWLAALGTYGPAALAGAIKGKTANSQFQQELQLRRDQLTQQKAIEDAKLAEQKGARQQTTALDESKLDPFRGYMAQAGDMARLDAMANGNFASTPVQADSKYGAGLDLHGTTPYTPNDLTRTLLRSAMGSVAAGDRVPTMTDPANYGKLPVANVGAPAAPATAEAPTPAPGPIPNPNDPNDPVTLALLRARRRPGRMQTMDDNSPWLA